MGPEDKNRQKETQMKYKVRKTFKELQSLEMDGIVYMWEWRVGRGGMLQRWAR